VEIECVLGLLRGEQGKRPLADASCIAHGKILLGVMPGLVERVQQAMACGHPVAAHRRAG